MENSESCKKSEETNPSAEGVKERYVKLEAGEAPGTKSETGNSGGFEAQDAGFGEEVDRSVSLRKRVSFPVWSEVLQGSELPDKEKASFEITLKWYLGYCKKARCGVSKETANSFIETVKRERLPEKYQVVQWNNALRWFFREAEEFAGVEEEEQIPRESVAAEHQEVGEEPWLATFLTEIRRLHYSYHTELSYLQWIRGFAGFLSSNELVGFGRSDVRRFLDFLAVERRVGASSQKQALNAIVFLYKRAFRVDLGDFSDYLHAKPRTSLPVVLSLSEMRRLLAEMSGTRLLMAKLQYGTGLRVSELMRLRVKDIDCYSPLRCVEVSS